MLRPGGLRAVVAENIALRKQLIALSRHQKRTPKLTAIGKIMFGILTVMISPERLRRIAIAIGPNIVLECE